MAPASDHSTIRRRLDLPLGGLAAVSRALLAPGPDSIEEDDAPPEDDEEAEQDEVAEVRALGDDDAVPLRELEAEPGVDHAEEDGAAAEPPVRVREHALAARPPEVQVLRRAHRRLEHDQRRRHQQPDHHVCGGRVRHEVVQVVRHADAQAHAADHHHEGGHLDRHVDGEDALLQVRVSEAWDAVGGKMNGNGAQRVEDDEDQRHDAGVSVPYPVEYLV